MSLFARARKAKENKKGFTLVELIVVLVILAILAAILVPALLGWIDRAREKQYVLEARNVYMATQAMATEKYAAKTGETGQCTFFQSEINEILETADLEEEVTEIVIQWAGDTGHDAYTIKGMVVGLEEVYCILSGDAWTVQESIEGDAKNLLPGGGVQEYDAFDDVPLPEPGEVIG